MTGWLVDLVAVLIAAIGSTLGTIANIPQIVRVIKIQCADARSYYALLLRMSACLCFLTAIMLTGNYLVALTNILMVIANIVLLYLKFYYSRQKSNALYFTELTHKRKHMDNREKGTVKFFNDLKGYGFIKSDDGSQDMFVHKSNIKTFNHLLEDGQAVVFEVQKGRKGLEAFNVEIA